MIKKEFKILLCVVMSLSVFACKTTSNNHNSQNSLDWDGVYKGFFPSKNSSCSGEAYAITLNKDLSYSMQTACVEKPNEITETSGSFKWNKFGTEVTLVENSSGYKMAFKVGENTLSQISDNGKRIKYESLDQYVLKKVKLDAITDKYWKLVELNGKSISEYLPTNREPHIILKIEGSKLNGTGGCNILNGSYALEELNRISFTAASTQMACANMEVETELFKFLSQVDNYTLSADGKYLSLNKAKMAPLARFEVVYMR